MPGPAVLVLDDGELDDVQTMLEELQVPFARVRGGAIVEGTPAPSDLLIATPRRIDAVDQGESEDAGPVRVVVVNQDSNALREQLRRVGFDYLVRRPVHPEALRLLLLRCLFKGDERRSDPRVPVGFEVSFRAGLLNRRAMLADVSVRGCRLLSHTRIEPGKRVRVQIPETRGQPFVLSGRALRSIPDQTWDGEPVYNVAVLFDRMSDDVQAALEVLVGARAKGPASLVPEPPPRPERPGDAPAARPAPEPPGEEAPSRVDIEVDVQLEAAEVADAQGEERRRNRRGTYEQTVPAFGNRALRVLVGRDLSLGGMRIDPLPGLEKGDRLHLAIYGEPGEPPFLVWGTITRDDGERGLALVFDPVEAELAKRLESLVADLPAVEDLQQGEVEAMGTVMSEILES